MHKTIIIDGEKSNYEIYSDGRIYSKLSNRFIGNSKGEYKQVILCHNGTHYTKYIHRLVAETFIPNPDNKATINHIDGNKYNNDVSNLEWATYSENNKHAVDHGLRVPLHGEETALSIYNEEQIKNVCEYISKGFNNKEIEKLTGVRAVTIGEIRAGIKWRYIANNYIFPDKYNSNKSYPEFGNISSTEVRDAIALGYTNRKIIKVLNLDDTIKVHNTLNKLRGCKINHLPRDISRIPSDKRLTSEEKETKHDRYTKMLHDLKKAQKKSIKQALLRKFDTLYDEIIKLVDFESDPEAECILDSMDTILLKRYDNEFLD